MTKIQFEKFQGTGNDFILLEGIPHLSTEQIQHLCDRRYGIGADGLILMKREGPLDFDMMYYNSDGSESFCGNGSRCSVRFAQRHGWIGSECRFSSNDGVHYARLRGEWIELEMHDVTQVEMTGADYILNTGSPHYLRYCSLNDLDLLSEARAIRYHERFAQEGINVNFLEQADGQLRVRTYERGVEDETLSCGTGVTAAALAHHLQTNGAEGAHSQAIGAQGGELRVDFQYTDGRFTDIFLCGPAEFVFSGEIDLNP